MFCQTHQLFDNTNKLCGNPRGACHRSLSLRSWVSHNQLLKHPVHYKMKTVLMKLNSIAYEFNICSEKRLGIITFDRLCMSKANCRFSKLIQNFDRSKRGWEWYVPSGILSISYTILSFCEVRLNCLNVKKSPVISWKPRSFPRSKYRSRDRS